MVLPEIDYHDYKFEDFQKSELIKEETVAYGKKYVTYGTIRNGIIILLKQEIVSLNL